MLRAEDHIGIMSVRHLHRIRKSQCRPFPILGNAKLLRGISRNFEAFDPLDFLAQITQHIPDPGMQMIRIYPTARTGQAVGYKTELT
jgi:hypothetical protein